MHGRSGISGIGRRDALAGLAAGLAALGLSAPGRAQSGARLPAVGFVGFATPETDRRTIVSFRSAMQDLGQIEGRSYRLEPRSSGGDVEKGHALIAELARLPVAVFLSPGPAATRAIRRSTTIPIVAIGLPADDSEPELFTSLSRPGGTVTGFSAFGEDLSAKRIEMLKESLPGLKKIGVLHNAIDPTFQAWGEQTMAAAKRQGIEAVRLALASPSPDVVADLIRRLRADGGTALIVIRDFLTATLMQTVCAVAAEERIAVIAEDRDYVRFGALLSYGVDFTDLFRRSAAYVDRILRGEKPGDLPIQLATKFELVVNLKTAQRLGIDLPASIFARADEVVD